ncbi:Zinc finger, HIT-type [Parasponia andersonii]|uniref:Zinc finger, HIT-type n=1 Tax=Parasponia andersonii TaxID=3476 RepID=A0A2P5CES1_PARAD|nr:Zinc finger, HIT-type [Parasponia andersonii]
MAEREGEALSEKPNPKRDDSKFCEECKLKASKYKCPGCSFCSCSLPCVKAHKQRTGCTGKRNRTQFVPLSNFDDNQLLSDYNLLEEAKRVSESAQRMRNKLCRYNYYRLPYHLKSVRSAAASRRTKILFLPSGMSKREKNQTRYEQRKKCIYWTIEWRFHSTDVVLLDHGVNENMNISSIVGNHLKPGPWHHQLKQFCEEDLERLKFFIRKFHKGTSSPFYELDVKAPLRQQLANRVVLEYPVVYVFLPSHTINFEIIKDAYPAVNKPDLWTPGSNNHLSLGDVPFKEEEIVEDDISLAPRVFDIMKNEISVNSASPHQFTHQSRSENVSSNSSERAALSAGVAEGSGLQFSSSNTNEQVFFEDMDFDFDQGLIDAYSHLIAEINPDDFLDLEGILNKEEEAVDRQNFSYSGEDLIAEDELEEGEIVE